MSKLDIAMDLAGRIKFAKDKKHKREIISQWAFAMREYLK
jgi:hypothetical protein